MKTAMKGVVQGKTIELAEKPGLPDGQEVSVTVEPVFAAAAPTANQAATSTVGASSSEY